MIWVSLDWIFLIQNFANRVGEMNCTYIQFYIYIFFQKM